MTTPPPRVRIHGRVVDDRGRPIAGAECAVVRRPTPWRAYVPPGGDSGCRTSADADGRIDWTDPFDLLGDAGDPFRLVVDARGYVADVGRWRIAAPEIDVGTIVLARAERIEGVVQDEYGAPAANVRVEIVPDADDMREDAAYSGASRDVATDRSGHFVVDDLAPGRYRLRVAVPDAPRATLVAAGTLDAVIVVPRATASQSDMVDVVTFSGAPMIRGHVVADVGARPIAERELRIAAEPYPPESAKLLTTPVPECAVFAIAVARPGRYRLVAYGNRGGDPIVCRWASTGEDVELRLPAPSSLEAIHLAPHLPDGRRATDFRVRAVDATGEYDVTDCEPRGPSIVGLPPNRTWRLTVRVKAGDDWFGPTTLDGVRTGDPPIDVPLAPSPTIDGVVVRRDGTPVVRARVQAWSKTAAIVADATTGLDGRFRLVGLAPGEWTLTAETDALETSPRLVVAAGFHDVRVVATPRRAPF